MRIVPVSGAVCLFLFVCAEIVSAQEPEVVSIRTPAAVEGELGTRLNQFFRGMEERGFSGVVLVARNGRVLLHSGYGLADRERRVPNTTCTIFEIGSLTKQFTAAAILKLEEQGRLRVTDRLADHLPGVSADMAGITIHHLLTHTAGLPREIGADFEEVDRNALVERVLGAELLFAPGSRRSYSNAGYNLLAVLVEVASGKPYERYLHEHLFVPAGLETTGYVIPDWSDHPLARAYGDAEYEGTQFDWPRAPDGPYWNRRGAGGLLSTPGDLYRWHLALEGDAVLGEASKRKLFAPRVPLSEGSASASAYGWVVSPTARGTQLIWHNGRWYSFYAEFNRYVDEGVVAIITSNAAGDDFVEAVWAPARRIIFQSTAPF